MFSRSEIFFKSAIASSFILLASVSFTAYNTNHVIRSLNKKLDTLTNQLDTLVDKRKAVLSDISLEAHSNAQTSISVSVSSQRKKSDEIGIKGFRGVDSNKLEKSFEGGEQLRVMADINVANGFEVLILKGNKRLSFSGTINQDHYWDTLMMKILTTIKNEGQINPMPSRKDLSHLMILSFKRRPQKRTLLYRFYQDASQEGASVFCTEEDE